MVCWGCVSSNKTLIATPFGKGFDFISLPDSFKLTLTEFHKNDVYPYSHGGTPYALVIGETSDTKLPQKVSVLAIRDNHSYHIGETVTVVPKRELFKEAKSGLLYITRDTVINNVKSTWIIGSENPAVLAKVLR
jgi:hypothetical protein